MQWTALKKKKDEEEMNSNYLYYNLNKFTETFAKFEPSLLYAKNDKVFFLSTFFVEKIKLNFDTFFHT